MTVFLGIDPGSNITGYGVIKSDGHQHELLSCGTLYLTGPELSHRLAQLFTDLQHLIRRFRPENCGIERVFMSRYADSALKLGQARGAAIVAIAQNGLEMTEYAPRQIKQAVAAYGGASKDQVRHMVGKLLNLDEQPSNDAADALAVAICHAHTSYNPLALRVAR